MTTTPVAVIGDHLNVIDETWWKVTRLVLTEHSIVATLARVEFYLPTEGLGEDAEPLDTTATDPDGIAYETGEHFELPLSDSADMLAIGETVKLTAERVAR